jgi:maltose alpha-D-glucosyltransferase / alpha-amylase
VAAAQRNQLIKQFRERAVTALLRSYWEATASRNSAAAHNLLNLFLIEKAAYEIAYEAAHRPTWIGVPVAGLARLTMRSAGE